MPPPWGSTPKSEVTNHFSPASKHSFNHRHTSCGCLNVLVPVALSPVSGFLKRGWQVECCRMECSGPDVAFPAQRTISSYSFLNYHNHLFLDWYPPKMATKLAGTLGPKVLLHHLLALCLSSSGWCNSYATYQSSHISCCLYCY